jgi:predicted nucleic acid-binding protein
VTTFVDTSAWYAVLDARDANHASAAATLGALAHARERLVTSNYVVVETLALIQRRLGMPIARRFASELLPAADVEWIQPSLHDIALAAFLESGRELSFVDQVSFALMRERAIATAFAFDDDFVDRGFQLVSGR